MNNKSKVLALKYRPKTFDDLIGQEVVAETITNSIKADKIPNAYLFTGIRGIGKTTTARIVANTLELLFIFFILRRLNLLLNLVISMCLKWMRQAKLELMMLEI